MARGNDAVCKDVGLLAIRLGIGAMFVVIGWPKWQGGAETWRGLGGAMAVFGITAWPVFWGFMAMFAELVGGAMLFLGVLVRPFAAMMCFTMVTATAMLVANGETLLKYSHALNMAFVFAGLALAGGGRFALGQRLPGLRGTWFA
jgi:putative oxidoreductase